MSKTIKQIADELGVSKQAVTKCIDNLGLRSTLTKNGNFFVVGDSQEKAIKQAFLAHQTANQNANQNANQTPTELAAVISVLQTTIDTLQGQLATKDEQIRAQQEARQAATEKEKRIAEIERRRQEEEELKKNLEKKQADLRLQAESAAAAEEARKVLASTKQMREEEAAKIRAAIAGLKGETVKPEPVKPEETWTPEPAWMGVPEETGAEDKPHGSAFVNLTPDEEDKAE